MENSGHEELGRELDAVQIAEALLKLVESVLAYEKALVSALADVTLLRVGMVAIAKESLAKVAL
jgi:hypothetical protein